MVQHSGLIEEERSIPLRMIYGYYPEVIMNPGEERDILKELSDSYLPVRYLENFGSFQLKILGIYYICS